MTIKHKIIHINSQITEKDMPSADEPIDSIYISGYASVNVPDRAGDVIPSSVWKTGMENYLKNPVILAYHCHDEPVGRMTDHKIDNKGLWIKARISAAAEDIFNKVKDGVITAFSVAFRVLDAEYNAVTELFVVKELELIEISVVSVPMNQDTLFSLSKSFGSDEEYRQFKVQFATSKESAKKLESEGTASGVTKKEIGMDPKQLEEMLAAAAEKAAKAALDAVTEKAAAEKAAAEKAAREEALLQERINKALAAVTPTTTGAERLLEDLQKRVETITEISNKTIGDLKEALEEKSKEIEAIRNSKMTFTNPANGNGATMQEKEIAVLLGKVLRKDINDTKFAGTLREKVGQHLPSATWELEVSTNMESEIRRRLVVAPIFRQVQMKTNVMTLPLNPETGHASWVTAFGVANSAGGTTAGSNTGSPHLLKEITLNSYKVATNEYVNFEEEEDSLIVLMPIIRDAMVRRVARAVDKAFLLGVGSGADPVKGVASYDATSAVTATATGSASIANMIALRKDLGAWGLDPAELVYIVSTDVYYDLVGDTTFQTVDKIGDRATLLTGQVGSIGNSPVLVSAEFPTKASGSTSATTNYGAVAVCAGNFIVGNQRGLRVDTQDLVETQRRVLVASLRTGMTQVTTNLGQGVSAFRWS